MNRFHIVLALLILAAIGVLVLAGSGFFSVDNQLGQVELGEVDIDQLNERNDQSLAKSLGVDEIELVEVGGVKRPARDMKFGEATTKWDGTKIPSPIPNSGSSPFLKGDENEQVAGLVKELKQINSPPSASSTFFKPSDFDKKKYEQNPQEYLDQIRPGRVFYPAQPGPNVIPIEAKTKPFHTLIQGESVVLNVQASPGSPVSFYTPNNGEFENRLTSFSAAADKDGIARAVYKAGPGTSGIVNILAASPVHSGQLSFHVNVKLPNSDTE